MPRPIKRSKVPDLQRALRTLRTRLASAPSDREKEVILGEIEPLRLELQIAMKVETWREKARRRVSAKVNEAATEMVVEEETR